MKRFSIALVLALASTLAMGADSLARAQRLECEGKALEAMTVYGGAAQQERSGPAAKRLGEIFHHGLAGIPPDRAESGRWDAMARKLGEGIPVRRVDDPRRDLAAELATRCAEDAARDAATRARVTAAPVVVLEVAGGFRRGRGLDLPHFALYADRTVIYRAVSRAPGAEPPAATHRILQLSEAEFRALLARIAPGGMQKLAARYDAIIATDPSVTLLHVWTRGQRKSVSVVGDDNSRIPIEFQRADAAISAFIANVPGASSSRPWPEGQPFPHAAAWQ